MRCDGGAIEFNRKSAKNPNAIMSYLTMLGQKINNNKFPLRIELTALKTVGGKVAEGRVCVFISQNER